MRDGHVAFTPEKQAAYLALIEQGFTRNEAAGRVGVSPVSVRRMLKTQIAEDGQPYEGSFAEAVRDLEEGRDQTAENMLYKAVKAGEPWAIQLWAKGRMREVFGDTKGPLVQINQNTVVVEGTPEDRRKAIANLQRELEARDDVIDVEVVEPAALPDAGAEHTE